MSFGSFFCRHDKGNQSLPDVRVNGRKQGLNISNLLTWNWVNHTLFRIDANAKWMFPGWVTSLAASNLKKICSHPLWSWNVHLCFEENEQCNRQNGDPRNPATPAGRYRPTAGSGDCSHCSSGCVAAHPTTHSAQASVLGLITKPLLIKCVVWNCRLTSLGLQTPSLKRQQMTSKQSPTSPCSIPAGEGEI